MASNLKRRSHLSAYSQEEWSNLVEKVCQQLRPYYEDGEVVADATFGHPADEWATHVLQVAEAEVSMTNWIRRRRTNEQLRTERASLSKSLEKIEASLQGISRDLDVLLGPDVDVSECLDQIRVLIPHVKAAEGKIGKLPKTMHRQKVQHEAAVRMTVQILRLLEAYSMRVSATADKDLGYISDAVKILKIVGDALELRLDETTWRDIIIEARPMVNLNQ